MFNSLSDIILEAHIAFNESQVSKATSNIAQRIQNDLGLPLGRISNDINQFSRSLDAATARVLAFGASASVLFSFIRGTQALVTATIDVEKKLTDINVILQTTDKGLLKFGNDLFNIAKDTGQSFSTVSKAATEFSRQGLGLEQTLKRTRDALILTRLSGLDVENSVTSLTAIINSFGNSLLTTTQIVNKLARVDADFAISSGDLAEAIKRVGSSAEDVGVNFDQLIALVTSVKQITGRDGPVIGNALKTIFTRLQRPAVLEQLELLGVTVKDASREALPAINILNSLAQVYDKVSKAQKSQIAEQVGGVFQINILKAALKDLSRENSIYKDALDKSSNATNEAVTRNLDLNRTLAAQINRLKENARNYGSQIGGLTVSPVIGLGLNILNSSFEESLDKSGKDSGINFGKAFLKGFGDFIQVPLALALFTAITVIGKKFGGDALGAVKTLLRPSGGPRPEINISPEIYNQIYGTPLQFNRSTLGRGGISGAGLGSLNRLSGDLSKEGLLDATGNASASFVGWAARNLGATPAQLRTIISEMKNFRAERTKLFNEAVEAQSLIGSASGAFLGGGSRNRLMALRESGVSGAAEALQQSRILRGARLQNYALAGSFLVPGITDIASQGLGLSDTREGRVTKAIISGISTTASTALLSAGLNVGPQYTIILAAVSMIASLVNVFKEMGSIFPELHKSAQEANNDFVRMTERLSQLTVLTQKIGDIKAGNIIPTEQELGGLGQEFSELISGFSGSNRNKIINAIKSGSVSDIQDISKFISEPMRQRSLITSFKQNLSAFVETGVGSKEVISQALSLPTNISDQIPTFGGKPGQANTFGEFLESDRGKKLLSGISLVPEAARRRFGLLPAEMHQKLGVGGILGIDNATSLFTEALGITSPLEKTEISDTLNRLAKNNPERFIRFFQETSKESAGISQGMDAFKDIATQIAKPQLAFPVQKQIFEEALKGRGAGFFGESQTLLNRQLRMQDITDTEARIRLEGKRGAISPLAFIGEEAEFKQTSARADIFNQIRGVNTEAIKDISGLIESIGHLVANPNDIFKVREMERSFINQAKDFRGATDVSGMKGLLGSVQFNLDHPVVGLNVGQQEKISGALTEFEIKLKERIRVGEELTEKEKELTKTTALWAEEQKQSIDFARLARIAATDFETNIKQGKATTAELSRRGFLFSDELATRNLENDIGDIRLGNLKGGRDFNKSMLGGFGDQLKFNTKDLYRELREGASEVGLTLKNSFRDAFKTFLDGSQSASAALRNLGLSFANKLLDIAAQGTTNLLFGGLQSLGSAAWAGFSNKGATGGYVSGGSGIRDDVPAMLNEGDFVIRKSSVGKYGTGFLNALNFAGGGGVNLTMGNPDSLLSNFAMSDENNPQNRIRMDKEAGDLSALVQYMAAKSAYEAAKNQRRLGALINLGVGLAGAGLGAAFAKPAAGNTQIYGTVGNVHAMGGPITRYAGGGSVDNVPALLTGGEFVMNRNAVSRHGVGFMSALNRGEVPRFEAGGFVGETIQGGGTGGGNLSDSIARLINSNEKLRTSMEKGGGSSGVEGGTQQSSPLVGSISINVQIDKDNNVKSDVQTQGTNNNPDRAKQGQQIGDMIKASVLETIVKETRNGGILEQNFQRRR